MSVSAASLSLPGLSASVNVTGSLSDNGNYSFSGTTGGNISLSGLPVTSLASGASATFVRANGVTSLTLSGSVSGGAVAGSSSDSIRLASATAFLAVASNGALTLSGSVQVSAINNNVFFIEGPGNGANIGATLDNNYLTLSGARLRASLAGLFNTTMPLPAIQIPASGVFTLPVSLANLNVKNFPFTGIGFSLQRYPLNAGVRTLEINSFAGNLNLAGFGQHFSGGVVLSSGSLSIPWSGSLPLGGFTAANGNLLLTGSGMAGSGSFNLFAASHSFNSQFAFSGTLNTSGSYSWTGTDALNFGGANTANSTFTLSGPIGGGISSDGKITLTMTDDCGVGNAFHFHGFTYEFDLW